MALIPFLTYRLAITRSNKIQIQAKGFSELKETGVVLDVNTALRVNAKLEVGSVNQQLVVSGNAVQVDTISTQFGEVIASRSMTSLPLNGRSLY